MTKQELRKIFDDAEKEVCNSETYHKLLNELNDPNKIPPDNAEGLSIRVNKIAEREFLFAVLSKILADK